MATIKGSVTPYNNTLILRAEAEEQARDARARRGKARFH